MPVSESDISPRRQALMVGLGILVAIGVVIYLVRQVTPDDNIGLNLEIAATEQSLGSAEVQAEAIKETGPSLIPDLQRGAKSFYINHLGDNPETGWFAFSHIVTGKENSDGNPCEVIWDRESLKFIDCTGEIYPDDGKGLRQFQVSIRSGNLLIDLDTLN